MALVNNADNRSVFYRGNITAREIRTCALTTPRVLVDPIITLLQLMRYCKFMRDVISFSLKLITN